MHRKCVHCLISSSIDVDVLQLLWSFRQQFYYRCLQLLRYRRNNAQGHRRILDWLRMEIEHHFEIRKLFRR